MLSSKLRDIIASRPYVYEDEDPVLVTVPLSRKEMEKEVAFLTSRGIDCSGVDWLSDRLEVTDTEAYNIEYDDPQQTLDLTGYDKNTGWFDITIDPNDPTACVRGRR